MKDVASCDKLRELHTSFDPGISEWGNPMRQNRIITGMNT
jgi:hypothetical protein